MMNSVPFFLESSLLDSWVFVVQGLVVCVQIMFLGVFFSLKVLFSLRIVLHILIHIWTQSNPVSYDFVKKKIPYPIFFQPL